MLTGTVVTPPPSGCSSDIPEQKRIDCWPGGGSSQGGCIVSDHQVSIKSLDVDL